VAEKDERAHESADRALLRKKRNRSHPIAEPAATESQTDQENVMKVRWIIWWVAVAVAIAACGAAVGAYFYRPPLPVWAGFVTAAALSLEALLWVSAGVFGWGFLEKRRATLARWRDRLFGRRPQASE